MLGAATQCCLSQPKPARRSSQQIPSPTPPHFGADTAASRTLGSRELSVRLTRALSNRPTTSKQALTNDRPCTLIQTRHWSQEIATDKQESRHFTQSPTGPAESSSSPHRHCCHATVSGKRNRRKNGRKCSLAVTGKVPTGCDRLQLKGCAPFVVRCMLAKPRARAAYRHPAEPVIFLLFSSFFFFSVPLLQRSTQCQCAGWGLARRARPRGLFTQRATTESCKSTRHTQHDNRSTQYVLSHPVSTQ